MKSKSIPLQKPEVKLSGKMVPNSIFINIYNALETIPQAQLTINVGSAKHETHVSRGWRGDQLAIFHRNKMKLKSHFDELAVQEKNVEQLKRDSARKAIKAVSDKSNRRLSNEVDNLTEVIGQWEKTKNQMVPLPELEKIPFSEIQDLEISNTPFMGVMLEYIFDLEN